MQKIPFIFDCLGGAENKKEGTVLLDESLPQSDPLLAAGKRATLPKAAAGCETSILKSIQTFFNQTATPRLPGFPCLISTLLYHL